MSAAHPGYLYLYSEGAGLAANAICALLQALHNFGVGDDERVRGLVLLIVGGVAELACSARANRAYDHFGSCVFGLFAVYWASGGLITLLDAGSSAYLALQIIMIPLTTLIAAVSLMAVSYYPVILCFILGSVTMEAVNTASPSNAAAVIAGLFEIGVSLVASYGTAAAVLHGVYERQVLPGFDDAILEPVLWKRPPLPSGYSGGKWANPWPLTSVCFTIGLGIMAFGHYPETLAPLTRTIFLGTLVPMLWVCACFHGCRHEALRSLSALFGALFFCAVATDSADIAFRTAVGVGVLRIGFAIMFGCIHLVAAIGGLSTVSAGSALTTLAALLADGIVAIGSKVCAGCPPAMLSGVDQAPDPEHTGKVMAILYAVAASFALYDAISELGNAVAQKIVMPIGPTWRLPDCTTCMLFTPRVTIADGGNARLLGNDTGAANVEMNSINEPVEGFNKLLESSKSTEGGVFSALQAANSGRGTAGLSTKSGKAPKMSMKVNQSTVETHANDVEEDEDEEEEEQGTVRTFPGDEKLLGQSDFHSPLFALTCAIAMEAWALLGGLFFSEPTGALTAAVISILSFVQVMYISVHRGQTSFFFLAASYVLGAIGTIAVQPSAWMTGAAGTMIGMLLCQLVWFLTSWRVFPVLSVPVSMHILTTALDVALAAGGTIGSDWRSGEWQWPVAVVASLFHVLVAVTATVSCMLVLGCEYSKACKRLIQVPVNAQAQFACASGFAGDRLAFDECVRILRDGGVCCIPTDTVYCLGCAANKPEAIKRIYAAKNRPGEKPLSLWLGSIDEIKAVGPEGPGWGPKMINFMSAIWPGSVSLVCSRGEWLDRMGIGDAVDMIGTPQSIALRVPNSTLTVALLKETGPLAITSANPSGACDCTHHDKVDPVIASKIDYILKDGSSPMTIASSVVDARKIDEGKLFFYRVGCVPEKYIWNVLHQSTGGSTVKSAALATIPPESIPLINAIMSMLVVLVKCESWSMYTLVSRSGYAPKAGRKMIDWKSATTGHRSITDCFETGITYVHDAGWSPVSQNTDNLDFTGKKKVTEGAVVPSCKSLPTTSVRSIKKSAPAGAFAVEAGNESNELVRAIVIAGRVVAVLQLKDKRDGIHGMMLPWTEEDSRAVALATSQLAEMVQADLAASFTFEETVLEGISINAA